MFVPVRHRFRNPTCIQYYNRAKPEKVRNQLFFFLDFTFFLLCSILLFSYFLLLEILLFRDAQKCKNFSKVRRLIVSSYLYGTIRYVMSEKLNGLRKCKMFFLSSTIIGKNCFISPEKCARFFTEMCTCFSRNLRIYTLP